MGSISEAVLAAGRKGIHWSMGMAVGLIPVSGWVITELTALGLLARVQATIIGRGGIVGAEGSTTFVIEGADTEVLKLCRLVLGLKRAHTSGAEKSPEECRPGSFNCDRHLGCIYRSKRRD